MPQMCGWCKSFMMWASRTVRTSLLCSLAIALATNESVGSGGGGVAGEPSDRYGWRW